MFLKLATTPHRYGRIWFAVLPAVALSWCVGGTASGQVPADKSSGAHSPAATVRGAAAIGDNTSPPAGRSSRSTVLDQTRSPRTDDPKARALFEQVCKAYQSLSSYSDEGRFVITMTIGGRSHKEESPLNLTFVRPNKLELDAGTVHVTSDGTTFTTATTSLKRFTSEPAPPRIGFEHFREGPLGAVLFGGPAGAPMFVLLNMLTAPDPAAAIAQLGGTLQAAPAPTRDTKPAANAVPASPALLIDLENGPDLLLTVNAATKLLSSIDVKIEPEQLAQSRTRRPRLSVQQFGWSSGSVSTRVAPERTFAFVPPKGFEKVDSVLAQQDAQPANEKVGKPAPDFTLTVLDGPGKTKTITRAELAGKVVVLDFWATWCAPCLAELPEIQKLIETYADSKKNVLIVAVSQDSQPDEIAGVRKRVEETLSNKQIKLTDSPFGRIALDPSNSTGRAFEVAGLPSLVILDGKGTIRSIHIGYSALSAEPLHKTLAKKIEELTGENRAAPSLGP